MYESRNECLFKSLFPSSEFSSGITPLLETASEHRMSHIGDLINPQHEQDQADQAVIGVEEDENYSLRNPAVLGSLEEDVHPVPQKIYTK